MFVVDSDDDLPELNEDFTLTVSNPVNTTLTGPLTTIAAIGTILDNEPVVTIAAQDAWWQRVKPNCSWRAPAASSRPTACRSSFSRGTTGASEYHRNVPSPPTGRWTPICLWTRSVNANVSERNATAAAINRRFTARDARRKLRRHYPCHS